MSKDYKSFLISHLVALIWYITDFTMFQEAHCWVKFIILQDPISL